MFAQNRAGRHAFALHMRWPDRSSFRSRLNYGVAFASEAIAPGLRLADRMRRRSPPVPPAGWRRVLLIGADHIGDVLYTTGSLPALRRGLPEAELFFAAKGAAAEVLRGNPHVVGCIDPGSVNAEANTFDAAICYNSGRSWREVVGLWRAGIPNRAAYVHKGFSALVSHPISIRRSQPYPAYFRDLVSQLTGTTSLDSLRPQLFPSAEDKADADALLRDPRLDSSKPILACFVTSRQPSGVWPARCFGKALRAVHARCDVQSVLLGAAEDSDILERVKRESGLPSFVAAGRVSLRALVSFLERCQAVLCADSGPRHLANAAGTRVFFVPNIAVGKIETGRYLESETDLAPDLELIPVSEQTRAFARIDPLSVSEAVSTALCAR